MGLEKQLEGNCRSDHYSGQSSNTKESCSSTPLNRCTSAETRWNKKPVSRSSPEWWLNFLGQKWEKVRRRLINWAESLDFNWLKKVVCCKTRIFVFFLSCRQLGYWSSFSGSRGNIRVCQGTDNCDVPNKRSRDNNNNNTRNVCRPNILVVMTNEWMTKTSAMRTEKRVNRSNLG